MSTNCIHLPAGFRSVSVGSTDRGKESCMVQRAVRARGTRPVSRLASFARPTPSSPVLSVGPPGPPSRPALLPAACLAAAWPAGPAGGQHGQSRRAVRPVRSARAAAGTAAVAAAPLGPTRLVAPSCRFGLKEGRGRGREAAARSRRNGIQNFGFSSGFIDTHSAK